MVLENGVEIGMDYNTVLALIGTPNQVWSDTMAGMGMERLGVMYDFHYDEKPRYASAQYQLPLRGGHIDRHYLRASGSARHCARRGDAVRFLQDAGL